jgi:hypothetical protein
MSFKMQYYYGGQLMQANTFDHVICVGQMRNAYKTLMENLNERDHLEDLWGDVIKMDHKQWCVTKWTGLIWLKVLLYEPFGS